MTTTIKLRASSADVAWACGASLVPQSDHPVEYREHPTEIGSAMHAWTRYIRDPERRPETEDLATQFTVDAEELQMLCNTAAKIYREHLAGLFADGETETQGMITRNLGDDILELTGHLDDVAFFANLAYLNDWKSGRLEGMSEHQQRAYCMLLFSADGDLEQVQSILTYVRLGYFETTTYTREQIYAWFIELQTRILNGLQKFSPGEHCARCQNALTCTGAAEHQTKCLALFDDDKGLSMTELTRETAAELGPIIADKVAKVRFIEKRCEAFIKAVRERVLVIGEVPAGDGKVLRVQQVNRRSLNSRLALPVIVDALSADEYASVVKFSISKVEQAVANKRPTGTTVVAAKKKLTNALDKAGAIYTTQSDQLKIAKAKKV